MKPSSRFILALVALVSLAAAASAQNHWHVSTYWAEYIDGHGPGNHALYCGDETIPACDPPDTTGGVGADWVDDVEWRYTVADPRRPSTVRLTGRMLYDLPDAGWDFLILNVQRGSELIALDSWTGITDTTVTLDYSATLSPDEFSGPGNDEIRLVWRVVTSADGWDDVDCINPSHGACQIDDMSVYVDGALITFDDFEPTSGVNWDPVVDITAADDAPSVSTLAVSAYPNPFNPSTSIVFDLPQTAEVTLSVYDAQGRLVRRLLAPTRYPAGRHARGWDGRDARHQTVASGVYFYRLTADRQHISGPLTLLK